MNSNRGASINRCPINSDWVIFAEDIAKGWPHTQVFLPAGEVYVVPVADSAEGKIVIDRVPFENGELIGVTLTVKGASWSRMRASLAPTTIAGKPSTPRLRRKKTTSRTSILASIPT